MKKIFFLLFVCCFFTQSAFAVEAPIDENMLHEQIKAVIEKNPDLILDVLRDNKELLVDLVQQGAESKRYQQLLSQWQEDLKSPKTVVLENRPSRGNIDAPVTLIAFSDFACTYCMQAAVTVENLIKKYPDTIRFVFKQFPADVPAAKEASRWFLSAIRQDETKGWNFYANLFAMQKDFFSNPTETLREAATRSGLDYKSIESDVKKNLSQYDLIINSDTTEAKNLGFAGTPHFLMNDLVIKGALPLEDFINAYELALKNVK